MRTYSDTFLEENFYLRKTDHPNMLFTVNLYKLIHENKMKEFIDNFGPKIKACNSDVVATYFAKYLGWALSGYHYILSLGDTFEFSLKNTELQIFYDKKYDYYGLSFKIIDFTLMPTLTKKPIIEDFYLNFVTPLLQTFVTSSNVKIRDLWGQVAIGVYHGHDNNLELAQTDEEKESILNFFQFITKELKPGFFSAKRNPLDITFRMTESPTKPGELQRLNPTCCLYYQTEGATTMCFGCPRMNEEERDKRREEIRAKNAG
ncbi:hypothetical protein B4U37_04940 [Sutcliffiella horikoshii]|uniref:Ferric siderophore reductase C-terminal domain-containing protein n=1 Tax=Sutcliffiella horikoshii TaxID=79883 RepID=A0ABN4ZE90_9BACI|nr:(2Fe-2S)-binding protein [Sutcliffiella horikoshii]ART75429.1 hypothetical protein B4U37_04940 [Sutcliffiella horikoshii]